MPKFGEYGFGAGLFGVDDSNVGFIYNLGIERYQRLITSQYQTCPEYLQWLGVSLQKFEDVAVALSYFDYDFDVDVAKGAQLDTVGLIAGVSRTVPFQPSNGVSPILDDATYRILIKASIARNTWAGLAASLHTIWGTLFPGTTITVLDEQNMSATIIIGTALSSIMKDLINNDLILPRSETVQYRYIFSKLPAFGFSSANGPLIAGFGAGFWS